MLDPAKRKCHLCYEEQEKYGVPIPNCLNLEGDGKECEYPIISTSLERENYTAWDLWAKYPDQILQLEGGGMVGAIFTLNLVSLNCLMELSGINDRIDTYRKIRIIYNVWRELKDNEERTKSNKSEQRTKRMRAEIGRRGT